MIDLSERPRLMSLARGIVQQHHGPRTKMAHLPVRGGDLRCTLQHDQEPCLRGIVPIFVSAGSARWQEIPSSIERMIRR